VWSEPSRAASGALSEGSRSDVVVIGAGIVGLSTALLLSRAGLSVVVLEARRPGSGTTGRSTAKATVLQGVTASRIRSRHSESVLSAYVEANSAGLQMLRELLEDRDVPWGVRDAWTYATDDEGAKQVAQEHTALRLAGVDAVLDNPTELPFRTHAGVRVAEQLQFDPAALIWSIVGSLQGAGVPVVWPMRATGVGSDGNGLVVECEGQVRVRSRWVIIATLLPFPLRTALFAVAAPRRSYLLAGSAGAEEAAHWPQGMYLSVGGGPTRSLRTATDREGGEHLLVGGDGHATGRQQPASSHLRELEAWAGQHFGLIPEHRWSAQDYLSADLLPHVGASPFGPRRVLVATGFGKWGMTNGAAAAIALAGTVLGSPPAWAGPFVPRVPPGLPSAGRLLLTNLEVGFDLVKGWVWDPRRPDGRPPVGAGAGVVVRAHRRPVALSSVDGRLRACSAVCTHLGGIVRWNDVERSWDCPLHGSQFAPDGAILAGPAVTPLAPVRAPDGG
jgi:glycine/D-amino acid oxidase-like deaminating enzyme/nitrite reductase/ring-hydroxylating ferredoxin subunit